MKATQLTISFSWSLIIFCLLNGHIDKIPYVSRNTSNRLMYIGFGITIGTRVWALFSIAAGGIYLGYSRQEIMNVQFKSIILGCFAILDIKPSKSDTVNDFYQNINMLAQLFAPIQWLFFYIAAMKANLIKKATIFTSTRLGGLYLDYIGYFRAEHHCILLGIIVGIHIGMAFSSWRMAEYRGIKSTFVKIMWFIQTSIHGVWSLVELYNRDTRTLKDDKEKKTE